MSATSVINVAYAAAFLAAPGAALAYGPPSRALPAELRLPTAVVLSPLVMSIEVAVSALGGLPFDTFIRYVAPLNLLGLVIIGRDVWRKRLGDSLLPVVVIAMLSILPVFAFLFSVPFLRDYGWHNMMQVSAIGRFSHLPAMPEDMDLAGFRLNYPWLGFAQLATAGAVSDLPDGVLFPVLNFTHFICMFVFLTAGAKILLPGRGSWLISLATGVALLLPGLLDIAIGFAMSGTAGGELRIEPMTEKFFVLDTMVLGLSAFALLVYTVLRGLVNADRVLPSLTVVAALACGVDYPLLFPSCAVLVGMFVLYMAAGRVWPRWDWPGFPVTAIAVVALGFAAAAVAVAGYVLPLGVSAVAHPVRLVLRWEVRRHLTQIWWVFGPVLIVLAPGLGRTVRERLGARLTVLAMFAVLLACFVAISMPVTAEYKFLFAALLLVTPVVAAELTRAVVMRRVRVGALGAAFLVVQTGAAWSLWHWQLPPPSLLAHAVPLDERSRLLHPLDGWDNSWMQAARDGTPAETVLLTGDTDQPVAIFTNRSLYVAADWFGIGRPDGGKVGRVGYSMDRRMILEDVKGYPAAQVAARLSVLRTCLAAQADLGELTASLAAIAALGRPVALHFTMPAAMLDLLRASGPGHSIFSAGPDTVWLIAAAEFGRPAFPSVAAQ